MPRNREESKGLKIALHYIKFRPRSILEVKEKLRQRKISQPTIEKIIEKLQAEKILDEALFAKLWVESRMNIKPMGKQLLTFELIKKGLEREMIDSALIAAGYDENQQAKEAAERKMRAYKKYQGEQFFQKMAGFLNRRGFGYEIIKETINEMK